MSNQQSAPGEAKYGASSSVPNRDVRMGPYDQVPPPKVGDALSAFLNSAPTPRRRDDMSVYGGSDVPINSNNFARPAPSRMNSFASARPSGPYFQNPFYNYPSHALPFAENSPFHRTRTVSRQNPAPSVYNLPGPPQRRLVRQQSKGFIAHDPFRHSHGKKRDKVPEDLTFDNIATSNEVTPGPVYQSGYIPAEIPNYTTPGIQYLSQNAGEFNYGQSYSPVYQPQAPQQSQTYESSPLRPRPLSYTGPTSGDHNYIVPAQNGTAAAPVMQRPPTLGAEAPSSTPPPAQPPRAPRPLSAYESESQMPPDNETTPFTYPPTSPLRPAADDRMSMLAPILEDMESQGTSGGLGSQNVPVQAQYDPYYEPPLPQRPASPNAVYMPNTGSGFGTIPDLNDDDSTDKRTWWDKVKSFFVIVAIIIALPVLYPIKLIRGCFRRPKKDGGYSEVGSVTRVPSRVDQAIGCVASVPKTIYHHVLLRLPSLYFSRVARIFEEADLSLNDLKTMALESAAKNRPIHTLHYSFETTKLPPAYESLKLAWEEFIGSLLREWKTFNIISVLLLTAILTILQIGDASSDTVTRYFALSSLVCALVSLLYGCIYIIRFGTMRKPYKAAEWALEAKKSRSGFYWNVWVLLAMPAVYLAWSLLLFICCIMAFVWRTGNSTSTDPSNPPPAPSASEINMVNMAHTIMRGVISGILALGCIYAVLIGTTFQRYGQQMDRAWKARIHGWIEEKAQKAEEQYLDAGYDPMGQQQYMPYPPQGIPFIPPLMSPQQTGGTGTAIPPEPSTSPPSGVPMAKPRAQAPPSVRRRKKAAYGDANDEDEESEEKEGDGDSEGEMTRVLSAAAAARSARGQERQESGGTIQIPRPSTPESVGSLYLSGSTGRYAMELLSLAEEASSSSGALAQDDRPLSTVTIPSPKRKASKGKGRMKRPEIAVHQPLESDEDTVGKQVRTGGTAGTRTPPRSQRSSNTHSDSHIGISEIPPTPHGSQFSSPNPEAASSLPPHTPPLHSVPPSPAPKASSLSPHIPPVPPLPNPPPPPPPATRASASPRPLRSTPSLTPSLVASMSAQPRRRRSPPAPPLVPPRPPPAAFVPPPPPPPLLLPRLEQDPVLVSPERIDVDTASTADSNNLWLVPPSPARSFSRDRDNGDGLSSVGSSPAGYESDIPLIREAGGGGSDTASSASGHPVAGGADLTPVGGREGREGEGAGQERDFGSVKSEKSKARLKIPASLSSTPPSSLNPSGSGGYGGSLLFATPTPAAASTINHTPTARTPEQRRGAQLSDVNLELGRGLAPNGARDEEDRENDIDAQLDEVFARKKGSFMGRR